MKNEWKKYWKIYTRLEQEISELTYNIYLCDNHLNVYSIHMAELLLRIGAECENIIKSIAEKYQITVKKRKMSDIINELCSNKIEFHTKEISIIWDYCFLSDINLIPFNTWEKENSINPVWYKAYNDIKHNRNNTNLENANFKNIINGLAGLFILNLYLRKDNIEEQVYYSIEARKAISLFSDFFNPEEFLKLSEKGGNRKRLELLD
jgi:hypothetical protein